MGCGSSTPTDPNNNAQQQKKQKSPPPSSPQAQEQGPIVVENDPQKQRVNLPELKQEPEIEAVDVPRTMPGYPMARPPRDKKEEVLDMRRMAKVDKRAREIPSDKANTWEDLVRCLKAAGSASDLELLRAIFIWVCSQQIDDADYTDVTESETPRGYMKLVRDDGLTYASFFAVLCRKAGIPCVVIEGWAKSADYDVGDSEEKVRTLHNAWNAAYARGSWWLVHPHWACCSIEGYSSGTYTKVESKGQALREKQEESSGQTVMELDEFYFMTDPEAFIYMAMPKQQRWQLLEHPWTFSKFVDVPFCSQYFFQNKVEITSKYSAKMKSQNGESFVEVTCAHPEDMSMNYELFYNHKESGRELSPDLQLTNYVFLNRTPKSWSFGVRFPETGSYKLEVLGGTQFETQLCAFKLVCTEVQEDCQPLPLNPGQIGFGPNQDTEQAGLQAISHTDGLVKVTPHKEQHIQFNLTRTVEVHAELVHSMYSKEELQKYVRQNQTGKKLTVRVAVGEPGEYALQINAQQKGQTAYKNVCNYLLTSLEGKKKRTRLWENPLEKRARTSMQLLSKNRGTREQDVKELESAIELFEQMDMEDKGDLSTAQEALAFKLAKKDLRDAINRRHKETLDGAIERGKDSRFSDRLTELVRQAEDVRDHLLNLNRIAHDVLEMKQPTISELRSYKYPPKPIHNVMMAAFIMLGEKKEHLEEWEDVQVLMGRTGKNSMIRRVREFDTVNVEPGTKRSVDKLISGCDEMEVRQASAGAGTFYKWLQSVSGVLGQNEGQQQQQGGQQQGLDEDDQTPRPDDQQQGKTPDNKQKQGQGSRGKQNRTPA